MEQNNKEININKSYKKGDKIKITIVQLYHWLMGDIINKLVERKTNDSLFFELI